MVLQVQPGDGLVASAGGGGAAPFRRRTHGVVGLELAGGRAPRGVGFVACFAARVGRREVRRVVLPQLGRDRGPTRRWLRSALLCDCLATGASLALWMGLCGLVGRRRLWRCALSQGPGRTLCWGFSWAKALATTTLLGAASPVEGVVFPSFVFRPRKPGPPRTDDDGVLDVTPFLKASLLKFVSATSSPSMVAFVFWVPVCFRLLGPSTLCCLSWGVGAARHLC